MKKIVVWVAALLFPMMGVIVTQQTAEASASAYTYLQYDSTRGNGNLIAIDCHGGANNDWRSIARGYTSAQICGGSGWVDDTWSVVGHKVKVQNWNTGNITTYGCNAQSSVGGGNYYVWTVPC